jgi:hypothetical protein
MIDDTQFAAWLSDSTAQRVTLFEIGVNSEVRYLSNADYKGGSSATPYAAVVAGGLKIVESISLGSEAALVAGDIEIVNVDGSLDSWLGDVWVNKTAQAWVGDYRWPREDFRLIFNGIVADIGSRSRDRLNIKLRDKLHRLNTPLTDVKLGGTTPNKDSLLPLCFGECHNVTPLLINPATLQYQVHDGAVESIFEVRDNGKPVAATVDNATGKFTLAAAPAGTITCSVQGDKPGGVYSNTISKLIQRIVTGYGKASDRYVAGDLDAVNLAAFEAAHPQPVGLYVPARINVIEACRQLASSVGAQMVPSRAGLLRLIKMVFPTDAALEIPRANQVDRSISIASRSDVAAAVKVGFCRNWTVQPGLQTSLPAQHKDLFAIEWLSVTQSDAGVQATYKLNLEPVQRDTCLLVEADAAAEATRDLTNRKVVRTTYNMEGPPSLLLLELGEARKLFSNRFLLINGKAGLVTSIAPDWGNFHVTVEVTI